MSFLRWYSAFIGLIAFTQLAHAEGHIKIASWNIEHLGKREPKQEPKAIAEYLMLAGADVLALQEIYDTDDNVATRTNEQLDKTFALLNEQGHQWEYVLFANKKATDTSQLCGVAWNKKKVNKVGEPLRIEVKDDPKDDFSSWDRHPHAVKFSAGNGKTDFVVICVHMKSNVDGVQFGAAQRAFEAKALVAKLDTVKQHFKDEDVIVIGDTNCRNADEEAIKTFQQVGFLDLNAADFPTFVSSKAPFDRIFVPKAQPEFKFSRQYALVASNADAHNRWLSDHFLVMSVVKILDDDDDN